MVDVLTADEVIALTGYKYPAKQCEKLRCEGIPFITRRDGHPVLTWTSINAVLSGSKLRIDEEKQPNFDAI